MHRAGCPKDSKGLSPVSTHHTTYIPPKVLQTILGHSNLATTMDTYAHVLPDTKSNEMQKLANLFL